MDGLNHMSMDHSNHEHVNHMNHMNHMNMEHMMPANHDMSMNGTFQDDIITNGLNSSEDSLDYRSDLRSHAHHLHGGHGSESHEGHDMAMTILVTSFGRAVA